MYTLKELDAIEIFTLMDNLSDPFTQSDEGVYLNESQYRHEIRKQKQLCGSDYCRACNGLSLFIRLHEGKQTHTILFDTGPDANLIVENATKLAINLREVDAIVLSHGHFDHYGGTLSALKAIGKKNLPVYIHPELLFPRAFGKNDLIYVSYNLSVNEIEKHHGKVMVSSEPQFLFGETALISGEVPRLTGYEKGVPDEQRYNENNWECAPDVMDERCLLLNVKNKGICVITGCGHTGIINATKHAMNLLNMSKIYLLMGGFHLAGKEFSDRIEPTLKDLEQIAPAYMVTGHCTGRQMQAELSRQFGSRHIPYGVGSVFKF